MSRFLHYFQKYVLFIGVINFLLLSVASAANRTIDLHIAYKTVNFSGESTKAIAINDQIPGPTLHFKEGDHVTINVYNDLDKGTAIHWHGLIIPWRMDGVDGVSQKPIAPGSVFHYEFTLKQSGTYWYHAHAGFQEQAGAYGGMIIDPIHKRRYPNAKDAVIVLSDWSNALGRQVYYNLKKEGDYYSSKFPIQPSLVKFIRDYSRATPEERKQLVSDYKMMQDMRMSIYDISDVAYDAFLLNGKSNKEPWTRLVKVGDTVRLRFIGAAGSTIFQVKIPDVEMRMVQVQGHAIPPKIVKEFTIAPGETYDILVKIRKKSPVIIYAESTDTVGAALGALITEPNQIVDYKSVQPFPEPKPVSMMGPMDHSMGTMNHSTGSMNMSSMSHHHHTMPSGPYKTTGTKYQNLKAIHKTNDPKIPVQEIKMDLSGYMGRYIWFINDVPMHEAKPILIEPGKRYRIIFINSSMMHHPMHIHGHWFILRNGHGAYDPLIHTIDVPPASTVVADFDADASGQWIFHCHNLYHMMAGMGRILRYTTFFEELKDTKYESHQKHADGQSKVVEPTDTQLNAYLEHAMAHPPGLYKATFLDLGYDPFNNRIEGTFKFLLGSDYNKLELYSKDFEVNQGKIEYADLDIFYWRLISQFWAVKGGVNYFYRPAAKPYWQPGIGIEGLMPYFIDTNIRAYLHSGSVKFDIDLSRDTQITNRFFISTGIRSILATKTVTQDEVGSGLNQMRYTIKPYYQLNPTLALFMQYEHIQTAGALKSIFRSHGEAAEEDSVTFGFTVLL